MNNVLESHRKELDRIANIEDYDDDDDAIYDGGKLLEVALYLDRELRAQSTESALKDNRIEWTVADNAKKAVQIANLTAEVSEYETCCNKNAIYMREQDAEIARQSAEAVNWRPLNNSFPKGEATIQLVGAPTSGSEMHREYYERIVGMPPDYIHHNATHWIPMPSDPDEDRL